MARASTRSVRARLAAAVGNVVSGRILETSTRAGRSASRRMPARIEALEDRILMTICSDQSNVPQLTPPPPPCPANQLVISGDPSEAGQEGQPSVTSEAPVRLFDGMPTVDSTDLSSDGFGKDWGITRSWAGFDNTGQVGNGWVIKGLPYLVVQATYDTPTNYPILTAVDGGQTQRSFVLNTSTSTFSPLFFYSQDNLTYTPSTSSAPGEFQLTDASGGVTRYYDVPRDSTNAITTSTSVGYAQGPTEQSGSFTYTSYYRYGAFKSYTDVYGNTTTATYDSSTATCSIWSAPMPALAPRSASPSPMRRSATHLAAAPR